MYEDMCNCMKIYANICTVSICKIFATPLSEATFLACLMVAKCLFQYLPTNITNEKPQKRLPKPK